MREYEGAWQSMRWSEGKGRHMGKEGKAKRCEGVRGV